MPSNDHNRDDCLSTFAGALAGQPAKQVAAADNIPSPPILAGLCTVLDQTGLFIYIKDTAGRYTYVNQKVQDLFAAPLADILGQDDTRFFDLAVANGLRLNDRRVIDNGETIEQEEHNVVKATGETRIYWTTKTPLYDGQGQIIGLSGISADITERKQMEAALHRSEARFRSFYNSTSTAMMLLDEKGFFDCNTATLGLFGCANMDEFCACQPHDLSPPIQPCGTDSKTLANGHVNTAMRQGNCRFEWVHKRLDTNENFMAEVQLCAIELDGRTIIQASVYDITEREQTKSQLIKSLSLLSATLDSTNDAILVVDLNNTWVLHNQQFIDLWDIPESIIAGNDDHAALFHALTQLVDPNAFLAKVTELYAAPEASSFDMLNFKNGQIIERYSIPQRIDNKVVGRVWSFRDVTARELAGQALKRESEKNRALLRNASDGIHILDYDGNIIEVSDSFCAMLGYRWEDMIGMNVAEWDALATGSELIRLVREQFKHPIRSQFESLHRRKDGSIFDVEISGFPLELDGRPVLFNSSRDISQRKQAEKRLLESENKYRLLIESAKDAIFLADTRTGIIIDCNQSATQLIGRPKDELIGLHQSGLHPSDTAQFYKEIFKTHIETGSAIAENVFVVHKDGHSIPVDINANVIELNGNPIVFGVFRDITSRKQAETELRIAATAFELQEGILITDADNVILRVNRAFTEITGYSAEEVIGKNPRILKSFRHDSDYYAAMWESINTTGVWEGEIWNRRKNGEIYPENQTITAVRAPDGSITNYVAALSDISLRKAAEDKIHSLAFYDPLTGLPNRRLLLDRLRQALIACTRKDQIGALLFLDLDHFKVINDTLGHDVGDMLLQQTARRLTNCVRAGDTVARLGGDEFVVMLENLGKQPIEAVALAEAIAQKILDTLNQPHQLGVHHYTITSSIGLCHFNHQEQLPEMLLKHADIAMYQAKNAGRNTLRCFDPQMQATIIARALLENDLRRVIDMQELQLHYQVQVDSADEPVGAEALVRWHNPERGLVSPAHFISLAEETGLILPIGQWVLETACAQLKAWEANELTCNLMLSVNVSAKQFRQTGFVLQLLALIKRHGINPKRLKLELTESMLLHDIEETISAMKVLGEIGVQFSLDDFGTGYSSLQYLKRLPLFQLKIDQSFVRDIAFDLHDRSIVTTIIAMAKSLDLEVIAEGVETQEQRRILLLKGCTHFQGYLFGKPMPIDEFEKMLVKGFYLS
ncbi:MAG: PAS domain S-box protein [Methylococcales bacterium]|nr:PAS domain S-box protein [Methylococcales bacterium]